MKISEILIDAFNYIKERKDHPILTPIIIVGLFTYWEAPYIFIYANYPPKIMINEINAIISNIDKLYHFLIISVIYFFFIPLIKHSLATWNFILDNSFNFINEFIKTFTFKRELGNQKLKEQIFEEQTKNIAINDLQHDISIRNEIFRFNIDHLNGFIKEYRNMKNEYISYGNKLSAIGNFEILLANPSLIHKNINARENQKILLAKTKILNDLIQKYSNSEFEHPITGETIEMKKIDDLDKFDNALLEFDNALIIYFETLNTFMS